MRLAILCFLPCFTSLRVPLLDASRLRPSTAERPVQLNDRRQLLLREAVRGRARPETDSAAHRAQADSCPVRPGSARWTAGRRAQRFDQPFLFHALLARLRVARRASRRRRGTRCRSRAGSSRAPRPGRLPRASTFDRVRPALKTGAAAPRPALAMRAGPVSRSRQRAALPAEETRQTDAREVLGLGRADLRVGRDQLLLRLADVGPALEQRRGKARRDTSAAPGTHSRGRPRGTSPGHLPEQQVQRILGERDLPLETRRSGPSP